MAHTLTIPLVRGRGPSKWDFVLNYFDPHPAGAHGLRDLRFELSCGGAFHLELTELAKPRWPSSDPWKVRGYSTTLPSGYLPVDGVGEVIEIAFQPDNKTGSVELRVVCPHCLEDLKELPLDDVKATLLCEEHGPQIQANYHGEWLWLRHPSFGQGVPVGGIRPSPAPRVRP